MALAALVAAGGLCLFGMGGTPGGSTAIPLEPQDAAVMASATTAFLAERFPAAASTLLVAGPERCGKDPYAAALDAALRQVGFAIASHREVSREAHEVRYHLTGGWENSLILRLVIDGRETSQLFVRDGQGVFRQAGPLTVKE